MRPGQEAPDDYPLPIQRLVHGLASMRPGQEAPDDNAAQVTRKRLVAASMRPGQEAPDDGGCSPYVYVAPPGFNEAGARSPG